MVSRKPAMCRSVLAKDGGDPVLIEEMWFLGSVCHMPDVSR